MNYTLQIKRSKSYEPIIDWSEGIWETKYSKDNLDKIKTVLINESNLAKCISPLKIIDENNQVILGYDVELDMRLPGCRERAIKREAKLLWEEAGKPEGKDLEFWLEAEKRISEEEVGIVKFNTWHRLTETPEF